MNEEGGAESLVALRAELLLSRGAITGGLALVTEKLSRRLWPGTPSNIFSFISLTSCGLSFCTFSLLLTARLAFGCASAAFLPSLSAAARDMRGSIEGGAVDATWITSDRLWPGTSRKAWICSCFVRGIWSLACELFCSRGMPARSDAARVVRGRIEGTAVVEGTGRALNGTFPLESDLL